ncbi:MAG: hypothetical protein HY986_01895 [Candidatus Melainabacteria bacterium]|nr:hypothetical protein [Candidatus Melainabacteria bacterium]
MKEIDKTTLGAILHAAVKLRSHVPNSTIVSACLDSNVPVREMDRFVELVRQVLSEPDLSQGASSRVLFRVELGAEDFSLENPSMSPESLEGVAAEICRRATALGLKLEICPCDNANFLRGEWAPDEKYLGEADAVAVESLDGYEQWWELEVSKCGYQGRCLPKVPCISTPTYTTEAEDVLKVLETANRIAGIVPSQASIVEALGKDFPQVRAQSHLTDVRDCLGFAAAGVDALFQVRLEASDFKKERAVPDRRKLVGSARELVNMASFLGLVSTVRRVDNGLKVRSPDQGLFASAEKLPGYEEWLVLEISLSAPEGNGLPYHQSA